MAALHPSGDSNTVPWDVASLAPNSFGCNAARSHPASRIGFEPISSALCPSLNPAAPYAIASANTAPSHVAPKPKIKLPTPYNAANANAPDRSVSSVSHS
jgi:hypothetical protein